MIMGRSKVRCGKTILPICFVMLLGNITVKDVLGQTSDLGACDYLILSAVEAYANGHANTFFHLAPLVGSSGIYFTLIPSVSSYEEGDRITVTLVPYNLGDAIITRVVIQAFNSLDGLDGSPIGEWTNEQGGHTATCEGTRNTIFHLGMITTEQSYQYVANDVDGSNLVFKATVRVSEVNINKFYFGIQSARIFPAALTPCISTPCLHGGTCMQIGSIFSCRCLPRWAGEHCEVLYLSPCYSEPCTNGGTCTSGVDGLSYTCACPAGWGGTTCNTVWLSPCDPNPCLNGGTCAASTTTSSEFHCICPFGFSGMTCYNNPCVPSPCILGETCFFRASVQICRCTDESICGENTPTTSPQTSCSSNICKNGGSCVSTGTTGYHCLCTVQYEGQHCEIPKRTSILCSTNVCKNGGTCFLSSDSPTGYTCQCTAVFQGTNCGITKSLPCQPDPCQNEGQCFVSPDLTYFICQCIPPWTGQVCNMTTATESTTEMDTPVNGTNEFRNNITGASVGAAIFVVIVILIVIGLYCRRKKNSGSEEEVYYNTRIVPGTLRPGVYSGNRGSRYEGQGIHIDNIGYQDAMDIIQTYHNKDYEEIPATRNDESET